MDGGYDAMNCCDIPRQCGKRKPDNIYLEVKLQPPGTPGIPIRSYLQCPPIDVSGLGLNPLGVQLILNKKTGIYHMFDVIGAGEYTVADAIEEILSYGVSRKLSPELEYEKLTSKSRLYLCHSQAIIANATDLQEPVCVCPKCRKVHTPADGSTLSHVYETFARPEGNMDDSGRFKRRIACGVSYTARVRQPVPDPIFKTGCFMAELPISGFALVEGRTDLQHLIDKVSKSEIGWGVTPG